MRREKITTDLARHESPERNMKPICADILGNAIHDRTTLSHYQVFPLILP